MIPICEAVILDSVYMILILQVLTDFIKSEPSSNIETCLIPCDSDHEKISIKEEKDSVVTFPVQKADNEVDDTLSFTYCGTHFILFCMSA